MLSETQFELFLFASTVIGLHLHFELLHLPRN